MFCQFARAGIIAIAKQMSVQTAGGFRPEGIFHRIFAHGQCCGVIIRATKYPRRSRTNEVVQCAIDSVLTAAHFAMARVSTVFRSAAKDARRFVGKAGDEQLLSKSDVLADSHEGGRLMSTSR